MSNDQSPQQNHRHDAASAHTPPRPPGNRAAPQRGSGRPNPQVTVTTGNQSAGGGLASVPMMAMQSYQPAPPPRPPQQPAQQRSAPRGPQDTPAVNWQIVDEIKRAASERLQEKLARVTITRSNRPVEREAYGQPIIDEEVQRRAAHELATGTIWTQAQQTAYAKAVGDVLFRAGRMQPLFEIAEAENIIIIGCDPVRVTYNDGRYLELPPVADSDSELHEQLVQMARNSVPERAFNDGDAYEMTLMLDERFRVHATSSAVALRPSVSIRQHLHRTISLRDEADLGLMPLELAQFLDSSVRAGMSIVVAGSVGAGKTVLLRALCDAVPRQERLCTLETDMELFLHRLPHHADAFTLFERSGMGELGPDGRPRGQVKVRELIPVGLRQQVSRLIVGEVRGDEAAGMFEAMAIGTGTMCTIHARDTESVPIRLAERVAQSRVFSIEEGLRQVAQSIDLIIHVGLEDSGSGKKGSRKRFITAVAEVTGGEKEGGMVAQHPAYRRHRDGTYTFSPSASFRDVIAHHRRETLHGYRKSADEHGGAA